MWLQEMSWPSVEELDRRMPVVVPIAAVEQHGHHLPLVTDSHLLAEILRRAQRSLPEQLLIAPLMWMGHSHHHRDFAGTLSAGPRCYQDMLIDLLENFLSHGFRRILLLNGHGGNEVPGQQVLFELRQRYRQRSDLLLLLGSYWQLRRGALDPLAELYQTEMGHACEWETSMMLRLAPQWVGDYASIEPVEMDRGFAPAHRAWVTQDRSANGHIGYPHMATAEKGEYLLTVFHEGVVHLLRRMLQWNGETWEG